MEIKTLDKEKNTGNASFILNGTTAAFANAIRRTIISDVPTMAMENIEFRKNNSLLYDEIVAHRLGLIPLKTDLKSYNLIEECSCEGAGCAKCTLKLTMKTTVRSDQAVKAGDIKSMDPKVVPVFPETPIVKLLKGQGIEFEATAVIGMGRDHMKFSPGIAYYKYMPIIDISNNPKDAEAVAKSCPVDVYDAKGGKLSVNQKNIYACHLCGACLDVEPGTIKLNESESDIVFYIEPFGQLTAKEMLTEAVKILDKKLDDFAEKIKK
ncbi:DNA-directed RNA polymerase subunit D [Candidatus Woesearchaeota archaeon]|nr:DNA-directed RNA polymerase subunit D [Candidatus Woesearchaeota archaeon]